MSRADPITDDDARDLVRDLAAAGGDLERVRVLLLEETDRHRGDPGGLLVLALTALAVTFGECLPGPAVMTPPTTPPPAGTQRGARDEWHRMGRKRRANPRNR